MIIPTTRASAIEQKLAGLRNSCKHL